MRKGEGGQRSGAAFLLPLRGRNVSSRNSTAAMRIEEKIAIAASDQTIRAAQDRPGFVPKMMIAPIARRDRLSRQQHLRDLTISCTRATTIMRAQIEDMPDFRLLRQRAKGLTERSTVQRPPESSRRIEPRLERAVERQNDGVDAS